MKEFAGPSKDQFLPHRKAKSGEKSPANTDTFACLYCRLDKPQSEVSLEHDNRVTSYGNSEDKSSAGVQWHYRYDSRGNRTQSEDAVTGRRMQLEYDAGNQLMEVRIEQGERFHTQCYRSDAFGRRLARYSRDCRLGCVGHIGCRPVFGSAQYRNGKAYVGLYLSSLGSLCIIFGRSNAYQVGHAVGRATRVARDHMIKLT